MKLPPLNALRAFEAAARTGSFSTSAAELSVSSAAVSQQVRKLEEYLGRNLFFRNNNRIQLTDAGRDLYVNAAEALGQISNFTAGIMQDTGPRPLVISALPSLAERWLPQMLTRLPDFPVRVRVEEDPVEMEAEGVDVRLTYGGSAYPGFWIKPMFDDVMAPMAAPDLSSDWDRVAPDLADHRLIHMDWGPSFARAPDWNDWGRKRDIAPPPRAAISVYGGTTALALAEAGAGVALGQQALAQDALDQGRLVRLSGVELTLPEPYVVVVAHARLRRQRIQQMLAHLPALN